MPFCLHFWSFKYHTMTYIIDMIIYARLYIKNGLVTTKALHGWCGNEFAVLYLSWWHVVSELDDTVPQRGLNWLKVPKCEIFDRSDFDDFYTITSLCEGDFGVKIKKIVKHI